MNRPKNWLNSWFEPMICTLWDAISMFPKGPELSLQVWEAAILHPMKRGNLFREWAYPLGGFQLQN
jgi:hypothetical protein